MTNPSITVADPSGGAFGAGSNALATQLVPFPYIPQNAPFSYSTDEFNSPLRGICSLSFGGRTWRFRTNPNAVQWGYTLNTHTEQTYGGRVVQLLSTKIEDLVVKVECGNGGWTYNIGLVLFLRDLLVAQRDPIGTPAVFEYTTRNWKFNVYGLSIPFHDKVQATVRELELHFKVQEDITGVVSGAILSATLAGLQEGVGWTRNRYNAGSLYKGTPAANNDPQSGPVGPSQFLSGSGLASGIPAQIEQTVSTFNISNPIQSLLNLAPSWSPTGTAAAVGAVQGESVSV